MTNITLNNISSFVNDSTAATQYNANNAAITTAFSDALSKSGETPNTMNAVLDMNNYNIVNLPSPATINSPVRLVDVINPSIALTVPPVGTSGSVVGLLSGNNTYSGTQLFTNANQPGGIMVTPPTGTAATDTANVQAALTAVSTTGGRLVFGAGKYVLNATITTNISAGKSITMQGAGNDLTFFTFTNGQGFVFNYGDNVSSTHLRDFSVTTQTVNVGTAITLSQASVQLDPQTGGMNDMFNVTIRGDDSFKGTDYFAVNIAVVNVSNINFYGLNICGPNTTPGAGIGVTLVGNVAGTSYGVAYNFDSCTFNFVTQGISYGSYIQGVAVTMCNFTSGNYGIVSPASAGGILQELVVVNSQFGNVISAIQFLSPVNGFNFSNNAVEVFPGQTGLVINSAGFSILSNNISTVGSTPIGIEVTTGGNGVIDGNIFGGLSIATKIDSGVSNVLVGPCNAYPATTTKVSNVGTNCVQMGDSAISGNFNILRSPNGDLRWWAGNAGSADVQRNDNGVTFQNTNGSTTFATFGPAGITTLPGTAVGTGSAPSNFILTSSTSNLGFFIGAGAPTFGCAKGSVYINTTGSSGSTRMYVNTDGATGWTNVTTAA